MGTKSPSGYEKVYDPTNWYETNLKYEEGDLKDTQKSPRHNIVGSGGSWGIFSKDYSSNYVYDKVRVHIIFGFFNLGVAQTQTHRYTIWNRISNLPMVLPAIWYFIKSKFSVIPVIPWSIDKNNVSENVTFLLRKMKIRNIPSEKMKRRNLPSEKMYRCNLPLWKNENT